MLCQTKPVPFAQPGSCVWSPPWAFSQDDHESRSRSGDPTTLVVAISLGAGIGAILVAGIVVAVACVMVQRAKIKYELIHEDKAPQNQVVPEEGGGEVGWLRRARLWAEVEVER